MKITKTILLVVIADLATVAIVLHSDIKDFFWTHPWWHSLLVAIPGIAVPLLALFELRHSGEANRLHGEANEHHQEANRYRAETNRLSQEANRLHEELNHSRVETNQLLRQLQNLEKIAANTKQAPTWAERNSKSLHEHLGESVAVTENESSWGGIVRIAEVNEDNILTLFVPAGYSSARAWSQQIDCAYVEITVPPSGPLRLHISKRYGKVVDLGEIKNWDDRSQPAVKPMFAKGEMVFCAEYGKSGLPDKRTMFVYGSGDGANSFLLEATPGGTFVADNREISKKFMILQVDWQADGFERKASSSGRQPYPLFCM